MSHITSRKSYIKIPNDIQADATRIRGTRRLADLCLCEAVAFQDF